MEIRLLDGKGLIKKECLQYTFKSNNSDNNMNNNKSTYSATKFFDAVYLDVFHGEHVTTAAGFDPEKLCTLQSAVNIYFLCMPILFLCQ